MKEIIDRYKVEIIKYEGSNAFKGPYHSSSGMERMFLIKKNWHSCMEAAITMFGRSLPEIKRGSLSCDYLTVARDEVIREMGPVFVITLTKLIYFNEDIGVKIKPLTELPKPILKRGWKGFSESIADCIELVTTKNYVDASYKFYESLQHISVDIYDIIKF